MLLAESKLHGQQRPGRDGKYPGEAVGGSQLTEASAMASVRPDKDARGEG